MLQQLPPTVAGLIRTASYGSWFNFYLCAASGTSRCPATLKIPIKDLANSKAKRCNS